MFCDLTLQDLNLYIMGRVKNRFYILKNNLLLVLLSCANIYIYSTCFSESTLCKSSYVLSIYIIIRSYVKYFVKHMFVDTMETTLKYRSNNITYFLLPITTLCTLISKLIMNSRTITITILRVTKITHFEFKCKT